MFDIEKIKGPIATIITPFKENSNEIDEDALRKEIRFLAESDIAGLFPLATTSEFPYMSLETKEKYVKIVAEENKGRKALTVGCCGVNYTESMQLLEIAAKYNADAAVVCAPYYYAKNSDELVRYYTALAENPWGVKIIMYNIPDCTSEIPMDAVEKLVKNPNIVGIKDSSGNIRRIRNTVDFKGDRKDFIVYVGNDDIILPALAAGCEGSMSVMSTVTPEIVAKIFAEFKAGNLAEADKHQSSYLALCRASAKLPFPVAFKMVAKARGMNAGYYHQMYDAELGKAVEAEMKGYTDKLAADYNFTDNMGK